MIISGDPTCAVPIPTTWWHSSWLISATLSNVNTPIGKYVIAHSQYTIIAGVPANPSTIFISAKGTSGTYFGDPAPITTLLILILVLVCLSVVLLSLGWWPIVTSCLSPSSVECCQLTLGIYTGSPSVHTPTDDGFIEEFGCLTHRSLISVGDDTFYCDNVGVNSIARVNVFNTLRPVRAHHLIDPLITAMLQPLTQAQISKYVFAVYDLRNFRYMLFIPAFAAMA